MVRGRSLARVLTGASLWLCLPAAADEPGLPISEARWMAPKHLLDGLTSQPAECLRLPRDAAERRSIAIGRAAFRTPLLLGGQAARAGLSCASCHRNGRGNPVFSFAGLSGAPGTADVTSSLMSAHRGDRIVNPKPIPDLAAPSQRISRDKGSQALEGFIRGLVVEEFDGAEPPPAVLDGLADYVRAIGPNVCRAKSAQPLKLDVLLSDSEAALAAASAAYQSNDVATARLLVGAARSTLGRIDQRFQLPGLERGRSTLREADLELEQIRRAGPADARNALRSWQGQWPARSRQLRRYEGRSFFSRAVLRRHLQLRSSRNIETHPRSS